MNDMSRFRFDVLQEMSASQALISGEAIGAFNTADNLLSVAIGFAALFRFLRRSVIYREWWPKSIAVRSRSAGHVRELGNAYSSKYTRFVWGALLLVRNFFPLEKANITTYVFTGHLILSSATKRWRRFPCHRG